MMSLESAREMILSALVPLPDPETVPIADAHGRVTAEELVALLDLPAFDNSAVDGYAVRCADLSAARPDAPARLPVLGTIAAGDAPGDAVAAGACRRIFTGAALPFGADAVVMQEEVRLEGGTTACFSEPIRPWEGVRLAGEDLRRGTRLVEAGQRLRPVHLGLLAAAGYGAVRVHRRPRLSILATGSELVDPGAVLPPGRIYDSNRVLLGALAAQEGLDVAATRRIPDSLEVTMSALREAAQAGDVVVTIGGVSVGDADVVKAALRALGGTIEMWRISMKPGKPFAWGRLDRAIWFGLPGNPVSAFVTWWLLVRPAVRRLMGMTPPLGRTIRARLGEAVTNRGDRRHFLRVRLDAQGRVCPAGAQASHIQSSLAAADALLDVPPETHWEAGREVNVELID